MPRPVYKSSWLLVALVTGITILHYVTHYTQVYQHSLYRELYYIPVIMASLRYGLKGGLIVSLSITFLYLPFVLLRPETISELKFNNCLEIFLFNVIAAVVGFLADREKAVQKRLQEAENLKALGQAVSIIAHDFKSPLLAIGGFATQIRRQCQDEDRNSKKLDVIIQQTRRLEEMVKDMLAFAKPLEIDSRLADVNDLVEESRPVLEAYAESKEIGLQVELTKGLPLLSLDGFRMQQALINLVNNAVDVSSKGDRVLVHTAADNGSVQLAVSDTGPGVPRAYRAEIFKPFVTHKKEGHGLGLPIVKKIIEAHGGRIEVRDNPGGGALFCIDLPVSDKVERI